MACLKKTRTSTIFPRSLEGTRRATRNNMGVARPEALDGVPGNARHSKYAKLRRYLKRRASKARRLAFKMFLLTGREPNPRVTLGWAD